MRKKNWDVSSTRAYFTTDANQQCVKIKIISIHIKFDSTYIHDHHEVTPKPNSSNTSVFYVDLSPSGNSIWSCARFQARRNALRRWNVKKVRFPSAYAFLLCCAFESGKWNTFIAEFYCVTRRAEGHQRHIEILFINTFAVTLSYDFSEVSS